MRMTIAFLSEFFLRFLLQPLERLSTDAGVLFLVLREKHVLVLQEARRAFNTVPLAHEFPHHGAALEACNASVRGLFHCPRRTDCRCPDGIADRVVIMIDFR